MSMRERINSILNESLSPIYCEVKDFSESHRGHAGYGEGGESHFSAIIVAECFSGKSKVERQRMVYYILADELRKNVHAFTMQTWTTDEARAKKII